MARPSKSTDKPKAAPAIPKAAPAPKTVRATASESAAEVRKIRVAPPPRDELQRMIQTAAYFKAEKNGFRGDASLYWKEAELEILARFQ